MARRLEGVPSGDALLDRLHGAWLGRAAGCLLGKPVENWTREAIREVLEYAGEYPLKRYIPRLEAPAESPKGSALAVAPPSVAQLARRPADWFGGNITRMVRDDDMDYPLIALHLLESYGPAFGTADVGRVWLTKLPYLLVYTAERAAYRNLVDGLQPRRRPRTATPTGSGSGRRSGPTCGAGSAPGSRSAPPPCATGTPPSRTSRTASTARCSSPPPSPPRSPRTASRRR